MWLKDGRGLVLGAFSPRDKTDRLLLQAHFGTPLNRGFRITVERRLIDFLGWWSKRLGLMEPPDEDDMNCIAEIIYDFYDELSLHALALAVTLSCTETIRPTAKDYGHFSLKYVCSVLNAYRVWSAKAIRYVPFTRDTEGWQAAAVQQKQDEAAALEAEGRQRLIEALKSEHQAVYQTGHCQNVFDVETVWRHLQATGAFTPTEQQQRDARFFAFGIIRQPDLLIPGDAVSEMLHQNRHWFAAHSVEDQARNLCRQWCLKIFFRALDLPAFLAGLAVDSKESPPPAGETKISAA